MVDHDHSYKHLFKEPKMVQDLLLGFVPGQWVQSLDFSTLEHVGSTFVSDDLREREDDMVWRLKFVDQTWLYVYLLLEFQSKPDPMMALRIMVYLGLLYQDMVAQKLMTPKGEGGKLPPVLPIVLYNGEGAWTAAEEMRDLVYPVEGLDVYIPSCRYLLLDEQRYTDEELKSAQKNLVAALFRLEKSRTAADIREVVDRLVTWLKEPEQAGIRRAFAVWLRRVLLPARLKDVEVPDVSDLGEVRTMLEERVIQWTKEWKQQGLEQGKRLLVAFLLKCQ
jgi:hypothetical protein